MELTTLFRRFSHGMEPWVFLPAAWVLIAFVAFGLLGALQVAMSYEGVPDAAAMEPDD